MTTVDARTPLDSLDFCDPTLFDDPWDVYRQLRDAGPLHRDEQNNLWVAGRHEDVSHFSRHPELYCNRFGVRPVVAGDMSIITLDGEEHIRQRRLVNPGFTPRRVRELVPHIRDLADQLIDEIAGRDTIDFVEEFAIHVPLIIICEMLGLDPEQRMKMYRWSDDMMAGDGHSAADSPELAAAATAFGEYAEMCLTLIAERRAVPTGDDLIGLLTQAFDNGDLTKEHKAMPGVSEERLAELLAERSQLTDDELLAFLTILLVAGNETTRNAISGGLLALSLFPEQKRLLAERADDAEFVERAVEELLRYVSPVLGFIRTVTEDHVYKGTELRAGDRILMLYQSANRDERVFERPDELVLDRFPNPHIAFGIGPHYCLGSNLARTELQVVFQELFRRLPDITVPDGIALRRGASTLVLALQELPARCPVAH
jgi:cytochrome P450 family 142 subfamily A polypeptide 1